MLPEACGLGQHFQDKHVMANMCCESLKKNVGAAFEIFKNLLKAEHLPKITMVVTV